MKNPPSQRGHSKIWSKGASPLAFAVLGIVVLCACVAPVGVRKVPSYRAQRDLTHSVLSTGELSENAKILLRRTDREQAWKTDPAGVLKDLHAGLISEPTDVTSIDRRVRLLDSLAELAFAHAVETKDRRYYLAAAMYAWLYLFPGDLSEGPNSLDRGVRLSADLYNRGLTLALTDPESGEIVLRDGDYPLPFGTLRIDFDEKSLFWGDRVLVGFDSLADLRVKGLNNRYRISDVGSRRSARCPRVQNDGRIGRGPGCRFRLGSCTGHCAASIRDFQGEVR